MGIGFFTYFIVLIVQIHVGADSLRFEEISNEVFPLGEDSGVIAAFGNFNSDGFTDLSALQSDGKKLSILKGSEDKPMYFEKHLNCTFKNVITGVIPGDFNGDSAVDVLLTFSLSSEENEVKILWGKNGSLDCTLNDMFNINDQPVIVDFNGDMIPDIIGESKDGKRYLWLASKDNKFTNESLSVDQRLRNVHSSGLIDLDGDLASDLVITGEKNMEMWLNTGNGFKRQNETIPYPSEIDQGKVGQSTFTDFNMDGKLDHIIPVCKDKNCQKSSILIWNDNSSEWSLLLDDFVHNELAWGFKLVESPFVSLPVTLRTGDVNMDGFVDFITVLETKNKSEDITQAVIMLNTPCTDCFMGRKLTTVWDIPGLHNIPNVQLATFFDIHEDGVLDIVASSNTKNGWKMHALKNAENLGSCFLKVLILSGLNDHSVFYAGNVPGPMVRYNMTREDGSKVCGTAVQLSQTAHFPLQLPYSIFGLGTTPNFIDALTVSVPAKFDPSTHKKEWLQIIPNSQIVVVPHPPQDESQWKKKLFVTPSHLVLLTCIALVGTCIFISLLVALLHWKERREDRKEKLQDPYRFHFDAM